MPSLRVPPDVDAVFQNFFTCELTTVNRQGQPLTWPALPYYERDNGRFIVTSSIAFPLKTANARRNPNVSMLFSDPTGSGLADPPAVLVRATAAVEEVLDNPPWSTLMFAQAIRRQPQSKTFIANPLIRRLFTFYFQRIALFITPRRITVWPGRDFTLEPTVIEVDRVE